MPSFSGRVYYITDIDNLPSIYQQGVLSNNRARDLSHKSFALSNVQAIRAKVNIPNGMNLHDYVPTYFNPRNATLFYLKCREPDQFAKLCILVLDATTILQLDGVVIADRNASDLYVSFLSPTDLDRLNFERIYAKSWHCADEIEKERHKTEMSAELLVPSVIPPDLILGVLVQSDDMLVRVSGMGVPADKIRVYKKKFFG